MLIGRKKEQELLLNILKSKEAEFVAVYGRRRVGKTYLITEFFKEKGLFINITGQKNVSLKEQLSNFSLVLAETFFPGATLKEPATWKEAFFELTKNIKQVSSDKKIILFIDELPWLMTKRSDLLSALDYYWNTQWSKIKNLIVIVCGSAASWMLKNIVHARGGLYQRLTNIILLQPFTLFETRLFLQKQGLRYKNEQVLELYMAVGGVPQYLKQIKKNKSVAQNINDICFSRDGYLFQEYPKIFQSLFEHYEIHYSIISEVAKHRYGISRNALLDKLNMSSGGTFNARLEELEAAGFIEKFIPYLNRKKDYFVKIIDEYTLFYLYWIEKAAKSKLINSKKNYWLLNYKNPAYNTWAGLAFEAVSYKHINNILTALNLTELSSYVGAWRHVPVKKSLERGAQVDLVVDRVDNTITLLEIKYSSKPLIVDKALAKELQNKIDVFQDKTKTKKQIQMSLITTYPVKQNMYYEDLITDQVCLKDMLCE